jgi:dihydroorotase
MLDETSFNFTVLHNRFSVGTESLNHDACSKRVSICASTYTKISILKYYIVAFCCTFHLVSIAFFTVSCATLMLYKIY